MNVKEWDMDVLSDLNKEDQASILDIPLTNSNHVDTLFMHLEVSGIYSIKSHINFYKLIREVRIQERTIIFGRCSGV